MARRLPFLNPNTTPSKPPTRWSAFKGVWRAARSLIVIVTAIVFACAGLYYFATQTAGEYNQRFNPQLQLRCWIVYTSAPSQLQHSVTATTVPESCGRLLAAFEALSGLVLMGFFVSRLVSRQQDRLAKRLVHGLVNAEIQDFRDQLRVLNHSFVGHPPLVAAHPSADLYRAGGLANSIARYWRHEAREPDLAEILPSRAAGGLMGDLLLLLSVIQALVAGMLRAQVHPRDIIQIRRVTESSLTIATVFLDRIHDDSVAHSYEKIANAVKALRQQLNLRRTI